jgi:hypothetical protein
VPAQRTQWWRKPAMRGGRIGSDGRGAAGAGQREKGPAGKVWKLQGAGETVAERSWAEGNGRGAYCTSRPSKVPSLFYRHEVFPSLLLLRMSPSRPVAMYLIGHSRTQGETATQPGTGLVEVHIR